MFSFCWGHETIDRGYLENSKTTYIILTEMVVAQLRPVMKRIRELWPVSDLNILAAIVELRPIYRVTATDDLHVEI